MLKVISLMGAPGTGKSTLAHGLFYFIRSQFPYIRAEFVSEFAKELMWTYQPFVSQTYITGNQFNRMKILEGKVDLVISESCLLNGLLYEESWDYKHMRNTIWDLYGQFDNLIVYTGPPPKDYESTGRHQGYEESLKIYNEGLQLAVDLGGSVILENFDYPERVMLRVAETGFLQGLIRPN